jgi:hypothetical protein
MQTGCRGIYVVAVEMASGAMIYITGFIKISLGIQKLTGGIHRQTDRHHGDRISIPLLFFLIRKVG